MTLKVDPIKAEDQRERQEDGGAGNVVFQRPAQKRKKKAEKRRQSGRGQMNRSRA